MIFDLNQSGFPSEKHKTIWRCGCLILPEELSLSGKVRSLMDADLYESCRAMRLFMLHTLSDMYENADAYDFEPWQLFSFWINIIGSDASEARDRADVTASMRGTIAANAKGLYASVITNTGIEFIKSEGKTEIVNNLYPDMFPAMREMQRYVRVKKERASLENSFQTCDFRRICPDYKYDKTEKRVYMRELEDRIPLILGGDARTAALEFAAYLREKKINLKWTGIQNNYSATGVTYGEGKGIAYVGLGDVYQRGGSDGWIVSVTLENIGAYEQTVINEGLRDFIIDNIYFCDKTAVNACNGGEKSIYACHRGKNVAVLGEEVKYVCRIRNQKSVSVYVHDPNEAAMGKIMRLLELEQTARAGK